MKVKGSANLDDLSTFFYVITQIGVLVGLLVVTFTIVIVGTILWENRRVYWRSLLRKRDAILAMDKEEP